MDPGFTPSGKPRLHQCAVCLRSFARLEHLKRHERSHTKEKPFDCGVCGRKFSRRDLLLRHAEKLHGGCSDAVKRLRRRRRSAVPEGPPLRTFTTPSLFPNVDEPQPNKRRRASFSALLGPNYARASQGPDAEFSTPQIIGTDDGSGGGFLLEPQYGDYGIYGVESPEDWVQHVLGQPQLEMLQSIKEGSGVDKNGTKEMDHPMNEVHQNAELNPLEDLIHGYLFYTDEQWPTQNAEISSKEKEISKEYDLISELNNLQNFHFYLSGKSSGGNSMDRNDSLKLTNSTQTVASSEGQVHSLFGTQNMFPHFNNISNGYLYYGVTPIGENSPQERQGTETPKTPEKQILFTSSLRAKITRTLDRYPFIGIPSPTVPHCSQLNDYVELFKARFSLHFPFINEFFLTEANMDRLTRLVWEQGSYSAQTSVEEAELALVCLALLVATLGACVSNNKREASNLYEASRRCIHVYLDLRKKSTGVKSSLPLWLVQLLTLSVIYGLFAEGDAGREVILKQVNALVALVRSLGMVCLRHLVTGPPEARLVRQCQIRTVYVIFAVLTVLKQFFNLEAAKLLNVEEMCLDLPFPESGFVLGSQMLPSTDFKAVYSKIINAESVEQPVSEFGIIMLEMAMFLQLGSISNKNLLNWLSYYHKLSGASMLYYDGVFLNRLLMLRAGQRTKEIDDARYQGVWCRNWKKVGPVLTGQDSLHTVQTAITIVLDVFFEMRLDKNLSSEDFVRNVELQLVGGKSLYGMVDGVVFAQKVLLWMQFLYDAILVLVRFLYSLEKQYKGLDDGSSRTDFNSLFKGSEDSKRLLSDLLQDRSFVVNLRYYKLILHVFERVEAFLERYYGGLGGAVGVGGVGLKPQTSIKVLRVSEFLFGIVLDKEGGFNVFGLIGGGLRCLRRIIT